MSGAIFDPIHGSIGLSAVEWAIVDARPFQRLRHIKQLGFAELAFPGATHTRYAHSLGAMQMVSRMFDKVCETLPFELPKQEQARLRQATRLAMLLHDVGHAPFSHVSERMMPPLMHLGLPDGWVEGDSARQATHEDFTLKILIDSELSDIIAQHVGDMAIDSTLVASLIAGRVLPPASKCSGTAAVHLSEDLGLTFSGRDLLPLLTSLISGEVDADRMDYLRRDAYSCGVSYGNFDHAWLCQSLTAIEHDGQLSLGLIHRGVWAFENFLLARYHMFLAVYHHHIPICFDHLLGQFFAGKTDALPTDTKAYLELDDVSLTYTLRQSRDPWAQAVVLRRPWRLLLETHAFGPKDTSVDEFEAKLTAAGVRFFRADSQGMLSKYFGHVPAAKHAFRVLEPELRRVRRIDEYTPLYRRFEERAVVRRLYCHPEDSAMAKRILA